MVRLSDEAVAAGLRAALRLRNGELPTAVELSNAPKLSGWLLVDEADGYRRLGGFVTGHPTLADGWCWTSVVLFIEPEERWARTVSRLYILESPSP